MSHRRKHHYTDLPELLREYSESRTMYFARYSEYHMRLSDDYTTIDVWTSGRYWVGKTDYAEQTSQRIVERAGEKGETPTDQDELYEFLDTLFYAADMAEGEK